MLANVLIVDDDTANRQLFTYALKDFAIHEAASGEEALVLVQQVDFDLALIDIELPDINGMDVVKHIHQEYPEMIVAMITATNSDDILQRSCQSGADIFIVKPFDLVSVIDFIRKLDSRPLPEEGNMIILESHSAHRLYKC